MESQKVQIVVSETSVKRSWELKGVEGVLPSNMRLTVEKSLELDGLNYPLSLQNYALERRSLDDATLEAMGALIDKEAFPDLTRKLLLAASVTSQQLDVRARNASYLEDCSRQIQMGQEHEETEEDAVSMQRYYLSMRKTLPQRFIPTIELSVSTEEVDRLQRLAS